MENQLMSDELTQLKPCPFCGGKPMMYMDNGPCLVECEGCRAASGRAPYENKAAAMWNRRATNAPGEADTKPLVDDAEVIRLRTALQNIRKRCFDDSEWARYIDAVSPPPWTQVKPQKEGDYWRWAPGWPAAFYCQVSRLDEGDPLCIFGEERDEQIDSISPDTWWLPVDCPPIPRIRQALQPQGET